MKKLSYLIALIIFMAVVTSKPAFAAENDIAMQFSDLSESYWAYGSIEKLFNAGIISGYPDGTFRPDGNITRAELVKITNMIFRYSETGIETNFSDIKPDDWFYLSILIAQKSGYINGYPDNTFRPNNLITREELCKILHTINNFIDLPFNKTISDEISPWAVEYVNKVVSNRIMLLDQNNKFRATEKATRAEACDALAKFMIAVVEVPGSSASGGDGSMTQEELYETMGRVTRRLSLGVIPELTDEDQKEIVNDIIVNMEQYMADSSHDYEAAAEAAYEKYKSLSEELREELKYQIQLQNSTKDLLDLKEFFFPDVEI
jgi:hypothetical protein